jgi:hypothetical protein
MRRSSVRLAAMIDSEAKRTVAFLLGPLMAGGLAAVSLVVMIWSPLSMFPEIERACEITGVAEARCVAGAHVAGLSTLIAFFVVIIVALYVALRHRRDPVAIETVPPALTMLFLVFCFGIIFLHLVGRELAPAYANRIEELDNFSKYISLEDLLWPLLIQLLLLEKQWWLRSAILGASLLIVSVTPYRSVDLAIFVFGIAIPLAFLLLDIFRVGWSRQAFQVASVNLALVALMGGAIAWHGWTDTRARAIESASTIRAGIAPAKAIVQSGTIDRLRQRLVYPFYQAAIVGHLAKTTSLPTISDEFRRKFRLSKRPNLDEFVYSMIYPGGAGIGEATTLYYGEGVAYFGKVGLIWALGAPLLFVLAWVSLKRMRLEASALLSIALWRSSFAGLITVLPSLTLQVAALFSLTRFGSDAKQDWLSTPIILQITKGLLLVVVLATAGAQGWATINDSHSGALAEVSLAANNGCVFDPNTTEGLAGRMDQAGLVQRKAIRSTTVAYTPTRVDLLFPYGGLIKQRISKVISTASYFTTCETAMQSSPVRLDQIKLVTGLGLVPLNLVALGALLLTAFLLGALLFGVTIRPAFGTWHS